MPMPGTVLHPDGFHGRSEVGPQAHGHSFFEGWYVKLVSADMATRLAVIPGVFRSEDGSVRESFVQVLDGSTGATAYHRFEMSEFEAASDRFDVQIAANRFHAGGISVDLPGLRADVRFGALARWPVTLRAPGAMGWYAWVPTMECYHGVVSMDHELSGDVDLGAGSMDLTGGRGYVEKDWGSAFPSGYVWIQSNHFGQAGVSLMASTAIIPWRRSAFRGDLVGLRVPDGPAAGLHRFATYTRARTTRLAVTDDEVDWELVGRRGDRLVVEASTGGRAAGLLHAPVRTQMHQRVAETLDGEVHVRLLDPRGRIRYAGIGSAAGMEAHGAIEELLRMPGK